MCTEQYFTTKLPRNGWPVCGAGQGAFSHLPRLAHAHSPPLPHNSWPMFQFTS